MSEAGSSRGEIFVVDDDPAVRGTLSVILCRDGYEVVCFAEGASFLGAARAREPACVLLDVYLPGRSGLDILKELNAEEYPAPILMISGRGDIPMAVEAIKHGALDFIEKPFRGSTVSACVQAAIGARSRRMQRLTQLELDRLPYQSARSISKICIRRCEPVHIGAARLVPASTGAPQCGREKCVPSFLPSRRLRPSSQLASPRS